LTPEVEELPKDKKKAIKKLFNAFIFKKEKHAKLSMGSSPVSHATWGLLNTPS
jgi:hypothetical protein